MTGGRSGRYVCLRLDPESESMLVALLSRMDAQGLPMTQTRALNLLIHSGGRAMFPAKEVVDDGL